MTYLSQNIATTGGVSPFFYTFTQGGTREKGVSCKKNGLDDYTYGFQGQERDDEVKGNGNSVNYKYRMHDPRLGRFFAVDPLTSKYPHYSPYSFSGNRVIDHIELEGLENIPNGWSFSPERILAESWFKMSQELATVKDIPAPEIEIHFHAKLDIGPQIGFDIESVAVKADATSVTIFEIDINMELNSDWTIDSDDDLYYAGKNGEKRYEHGFELSTEALGISVKREYSETYGVLTKDQSTTTTTYMGVSLNETTDNLTGETTTSKELSVGAEAMFIFGYSASASIKTKEE